MSIRFRLLSATPLALVLGCVAEPGHLAHTDDTDYELEVARIDESVAHLEARAESDPGDWLVLERLAGLRLDRARLTGSYADLSAASGALDQAFTIAAPGSGPWMSRARLDYTLHRLDRVEASLSAVEARALIPSSVRAAIEDLRADVAFQSGRYDDAVRRYEAAVDADPNLAALYRLAHYRWSTGAYDEAEALIRAAAASYHGASASQRAWFELQLGLMDLDRGRYLEALDHYRNGAVLCAGWWLLEEHMAEALALEGRIEEAIEIYEDVVARTGSPELMGALSALLRERDPARATHLFERATEIYDERLEVFPEASYGHALDHYLAGDDRERALALAEANFELRPGVPARIGLSHALLRLDRAEDALEVLAPALASPWRSAELFGSAAIAEARLGLATEAAAHRRAALSINPDVMDQLAWLQP